ncbi:hypothetical protein RHSIM_Rhsim09G0034600 [Rhododendron simsii]|uniref:Retroviral polymerase SH3-like domain-containing protein n=1 Tax=Rhododendron simsii TaxID=118357 RepID=A0A834LBM9_RHOSS|nr:hypothetical protein RHSIM_Rhsim09G0034600 [Rhododendron simsii]
MARSMLKSKKMPKEFWAEAVDCAIYLLNRCPTRSVDNRTPQEEWGGFKPSVSHLRIFGSIAYAHVPDEKRTKLDEKSEKFVFIGYDSRSKGYKLYNPSNGKIVISRDMEFDGESEWDWSNPEEDYDFFPFLEEEEQGNDFMEPAISPPPSPPGPTHVQASPFSSESGSTARPPRMRGLQEIYDTTEEVDSTLFKSLVGSLRYLTCTRPDILFGVGLISRYMEAPTMTHFKAAKRILRYLKVSTKLVEYEIS